MQKSREDGVCVRKTLQLVEGLVKAVWLEWGACTVTIFLVCSLSSVSAGTCVPSEKYLQNGKTSILSQWAHCLPQNLSVETAVSFGASPPLPGTRQAGEEFCLSWKMAPVIIWNQFNGNQFVRCRGQDCLKSAFSFGISSHNHLLWCHLTPNISEPVCR